MEELDKEREGSSEGTDSSNEPDCTPRATLPVASCPIPGSVLGPIDPSELNQRGHEYRHCGRHFFHAACACEASGSEAFDNCGCQILANVTAVVPGRQATDASSAGAFAAAFTPAIPAAPFKVVQPHQVSNAQKPRKHSKVTWTVAQQEVWNLPREALKKEKKRMAEKRRAVKIVPSLDEA
mmetsp:Transcript_6741/g.18870  ORF Transcript_6741/g.18870 Transcript_6741/m.18870 type:complete len:181 (-) Transcript_6741:152-694(-)